MSTERDEHLATELARLDRIVRSLESEPNAALRERAMELIEAFDEVHRQLVWDLGERLWEHDAALFERLLEDPRVSVLFELYGLVSPSRKRDAADGVIGLDELVATLPPRREGGA